MKAIIIGAGVGGMASACRLSKLGIECEIYEMKAKVGGRLSSIQEKGFRIDRGPTLLLMPWVLKEFFSDLDRDINNYLELKQLDPVYRIHFDDGSTIEPSAFKERMLETISQISKKDAGEYERFLKDYKKYYEIALREFIMKNFDSPLDMINPAGISSLLSGGALKDLYSKTGEYFNDPRVRIAFSLQSIYIGDQPKAIPSVYGLIPYVEFTEGVWYPKGGLYSVADSLLALCKEMNVKINLNSQVKCITIEKGRATGIETENGKKVPSDIVIANVDLPSAYLDLIPEEERPHMKDNKINQLSLSCSAFMLYLGIDGKCDIEHHNFILPVDYQTTFNEIFEKKEIPEKPGIYIANPSSHDPDLAPEGKSVLYVLVPVPNLTGAANWKEESKRVREMALDALESIGVENIRERIVFEKIVTPEDWLDEYKLMNGATFGLSPKLLQSAAFRPPNKDKKIKNLYFVGASTHPGSGIPIVLLSSKLLEMRIKEDFDV